MLACAVVLVTADGIGLSDGLADLLGNCLRPLGRGLLLLAQVFQHDHELVAAQPCDAIVVTHTGPQPARNLGQQLIADVVALCVVECLEVIEIDEQDGAVLAVAGARGECLAQALEQEATVGQLGQRIVERQPVKLRLRLLVVRDIGEGRDVVGDAPVRRLYRGDGHPYRIHFPVLATIPKLALPVVLVPQRLPHASHRTA